MTDTANNWLSSRKIGLPMLRQVNRNINILKTEAIILDVGNYAAFRHYIFQLIQKKTLLKFQSTFLLFNSDIFH
jgi:hypothetical protein